MTRKSEDIESDAELEDVEQTTVHTHRSEDVLRYLYHEKELKQEEIAERYGKTQETIHYWFKRHDIETRSAKDYRDGVNSYTDSNGRNIIGVRTGDGWKTFRLSQLTALVDYAVREVFRDGYLVHHRLPHKGVDVPENLQVLPRAEHQRLHATKGHDSEDLLEEPDWMRDESGVQMSDDEEGTDDASTEA